MNKVLLFCTSATFLFWPPVVSRAVGCGARKGPRVQYVRHMFGPRPGFVVRALGVPRRAELALFARSISGEPESKSVPWKPPNCLLFYFALCCCVSVSVTSTYTSLRMLDALTQPLYNNSPASTFPLCDTRER